MTNHNLHPQHHADLQRSGLSDESIRSACIATVPPGKISKRLGYDDSGLSSMYEIPYGEGFSRYRCFYLEGKAGPKYLQPKNSGNRLYIPSLAASILNDPTKPLYITEGEKKALKACQEGLPCVGLPGLWNWKIKGGGLIADFEKIVLRDRQVIIVPDNDYRKPGRNGYKKNLEMAVDGLAQAMMGRGAHVSVVQLPDGPAKGLDDYLCSRTVASFHALPVREVRPANGATEEKREREAKTDRLIKLALDKAELFHDADTKAYATIRNEGHRETYLLKSKSFRTWLSGQLWKTYRQGCSVQNVQDALGTIEAHALYEGSCHTVHVRLASCHDRIFLDLGNDRFEVVEITAAGWRILENQNLIKFRRPPGMAALPRPAEGGSIETLKRYVNLANPTDWPLVAGFILGCFHPSGPYPILAITGEQGSAKSTLMRIIKAITDPSTAPLRSTPSELRDLAISANNSWTLSFDNLSHIPDWLSDALCRLATGGGFATRTLYSDDGETIFDSKRPVMLNCIEHVIRRHDLADRAIVVGLAVIPEERRIPEKDFWGDFEDDAPEILGAILDAVSCALRNVDAVKLSSYPRMADFARWATAAEAAFGWAPGTFAEAYARNRSDVTMMTLDNDPVGMAINLFMEDRLSWEGTATELLNELEGMADERTIKAKGWPKAAHVLSGKLKRSATALRTNGISVSFPPRTDKQRLIRLEQVGEKSVRSVIEAGNKVHNIDMTDKSAMTLSRGGSVMGASYGHGDRHGDRANDASDVTDDAFLIGSVMSMTDKKGNLSNNYGTHDAHDARDASIPPLLQDNLREGII